MASTAKIISPQSSKQAAIQKLALAVSAVFVLWIIPTHAIWMERQFSYVPDSVVLGVLVIAFLASQFCAPLPPWPDPRPKPGTPEPDPKREH
jgi:hypothetical protein